MFPTHAYSTSMSPHGQKYVGTCSLGGDRGALLPIVAPGFIIIVQLLYVGKLIGRRIGYVVWVLVLDPQLVIGLLQTRRHSWRIINPLKASGESTQAEVTEPFADSILPVGGSC